MKRLVWFFSLVVLPLTASAAQLEHTIYTASPEGFLVNATLISGHKDAILIDAMFTLSDAKKLADEITATKKNLTTIFITHDHPDHYFGLTVLKEKFPKAKIIALPAVVEAIKKTAKAKATYWGGMYKDNIPSDPIIPEPFTKKSLSLEGKTLELKGGMQGDDAINTYVWIPSIKTVVTGDIVYDGVHLWTAETNPAERKVWATALDALNALKPAVVIPGHQRAERQGAPSNITFCKEYLAAYDEALAASKNAEELQQKMKAKYADLALDVILKIGAEAAFKK